MEAVNRQTSRKINRYTQPELFSQCQKEAERNEVQQDWISVSSVGKEQGHGKTRLASTGYAGSCCSRYG